MSNIYLYSVQLARMSSTVYINLYFVKLFCRVVYWINVYMHGVFEFYISFILIIFSREVLNMVVLVEDKVYY